MSGRLGSTPTSIRRSLNTTEDPIELDWAPAYRRQKAALRNDEVRRSVELAEETLAVDPNHRHRRFERHDGTVIDWNEPGLLISFRVEDHGAILFIAFRDLWNR